MQVQPVHPPAVLRRIAGALVLLWLVLTITFALIRLAPGDAATFLVPPSASAAEVARLRTELGLDRSLGVQYARWASDLLHANLGESFSLHEPVARALADALPVSAGLGLASLTLTFLIGVPIGVIQAIRRGRPLDRVLTVGTTVVYAAPSFWIALALVAVFTYGAASWGLPRSLWRPAVGRRPRISSATRFFRCRFSPPSARRASRATRGRASPTCLDRTSCAPRAPRVRLHGVSTFGMCSPPCCRR